MLFKLEMLGEQLRGTGTLLTLQCFVLEDTSHIRYTQSRPS